MDPHKNPIIDVQNVSKQYADHQVNALNQVSLSVAPGEFVTLMGPSGCGKSTLLNIIGAIDTPSSGKVLVNGVDLTQLSDRDRTETRRTSLGFIFQFFNLLTTLSVAENVALPLELQHEDGKKTQDRVQYLLDKVGLAHRANFYPAQISGGEMQRVAIARALIHNPAIILADEPTGNLDSENGEQILTLLKSLAKDNGQTIVMATHSQEAAQFGDRTLRIRDGKLLPEQQPVGRV